MMNRREFLRGLGLTTLSALVPQFAWANNVSFSRDRRLLILVELKGGNDGLNTLVPYTQSAYYDNRPRIAIAETELSKLSGQLGMHPELNTLLTAWNEGEMAWVQGLGYPEANRSHFESIEIWDNAVTDHRGLNNGWVASCFPDHSLGGVAVNTNLGPLLGDGFSALSVSDPQHFINRGSKLSSINAIASPNNALQHIVDIHAEVDMMADTLAEYLKDIPEAKQAFQANAFGRSLNSVYTLVASGINVPAYKVTLNGFDTHVTQPAKHASLLGILGQGLAALRINLQQLGMWDEVVVMTYAEFGRRVKENSSRGTDHGTAAPHMVLGGKVQGGFYGKYPSLTNLDDKGDLVYTTDFRDMYATIREDWWGLKSDGQSASLGFL